jgi:hypothetical protein
VTPPDANSLTDGALALWNSPGFQALLVPVRTLSSISAMFWMLSRLSDLVMAAVKRVIFAEAYALLNVVYAALLSAAYALMMFYTALNGQWHPSLLWREICGFGFMYVMLGVTFRDRRTGRLKPHTPPAFFLGVVGYLFLSRAPSLIKLPGVAEFHRVLELFAAGGWGWVMTGFTVLVMAWSLLHMLVSELAFGLSPLLFRLKLIRSLPIRFRFDEGVGRGVVPSLSRSWFLLTLLAGGAAVLWHWWPKLRAAGEAAAPAIQNRAQSPEAAEAAARLRSVLPAVSFTAVGSLPREGAMADLARPVFRKLLSAPRAADRWLAAAALDRADPSFSVSREELFRSSAPAAADCSRGGFYFALLSAALPDDPAESSALFWIEDARGVHFSGIGPGGFSPAGGRDGCPAGVFGAERGPFLLAFSERPGETGGPFRLWFSAYDAAGKRVIAAARAGAGVSGDFSLAATRDGVTWADAPVSSAAASCAGGCGNIAGSAALSVTTEPLAEYRGAAVDGGSIRIAALPALTYERSGLAAHFRSRDDFEAAFRFDPAAGFLNRWYRLARLADGRSCVSVSLDPALPGAGESPDWACAR